MLRKPSVAGLPAKIEQILKQWRVVVKFARHRKSFHDRARFNNVKPFTSEWRPPFINETKHDGKRAELQPERRIVADLDVRFKISCKLRGASGRLTDQLGQ